jgi:glutathione S-transferase
VGRPVVFGAAYSVYVRAVRLALAEKGVAYRLEEVDVFAPGGPPEAYRTRHPFGRIPAFEHDGFALYETAAITRYIDEACPGPALMPTTPRARARATQIVGILDRYAYRAWVWDIYVERVDKPSAGSGADEAKIAAAMPRANTCLDAIQDSMSGESYFLGTDPTLADLHAAPMFDLLLRAPEGAVMLAARPRWQAWWSVMSRRPSMAATRPAAQSK